MTRRDTNSQGRRAFLAGSAAFAVTATVAGSAGALQPDPIFAAIEAHKAARAVVYSAIDAVTAVERELAGDGLERHSERKDDPRTVACEDALSRAFAAEDDAACALVTELPTTMTGVLALLKYANAADTDGKGWPDDLQSEDDSKRRSWHYFLIEALAEVLPGMIATGAVR